MRNVKLLAEGEFQSQSILTGVHNRTWMHCYYLAEKVLQFLSVSVRSEYSPNEIACSLINTSFEFEEWIRYELFHQLKDVIEVMPA